MRQWRCGGLTGVDLVFYFLFVSLDNFSSRVTKGGNLGDQLFMKEHERGLYNGQVVGLVE